MNTNVYTKLNNARLKLLATPLSKTGHNKFAGYHYFELGDFLPAVQRIFAELGLCGIVSYTADLAKLTIHNAEGGDSIEITSPMGSAALKGCHEVQNVGAVETYQRRYLWVTAMEIVEHDVLDATTGKDKPASAKSVTQDEWDNLDGDTQKWLQGIADSVRVEISTNGAAAGLAVLEEQGLSAEHKIACWSRFDSKERSAMKAAGKKAA